MPITASNPFKWRHYPRDIILWCVRWYLRFPISFAHMAEMALERGLIIHSSCIWRWVQIFGPELDKRCRAHLKHTNRSYRVDETYIRIKGQDRYLYRAVDSTGQTVDFLLTAKRDAAAAKRFFRKTLLDPANPQPRVINVDKNRAYPAAVEELKVEGTLRRRCRLRQCKYLNNVIEQDHRVSKKQVWLGRGYQSFSTAWRTLQGIEAVHMIRKGRVKWVGKDDPIAQLLFYRRVVWADDLTPAISRDRRRSRVLRFSQRYLGKCCITDYDGRSRVRRRFEPVMRHQAECERPKPVHASCGA